MGQRRFSFLDSVVGEIDKAIKVLAAPARSGRIRPDVSRDEPKLTDRDARESARLMRVNHAGEVAAQALYQGQAFTARRPTVAAAMRAAAAEEMDHLSWCEQRIADLHGTTSVLNPLWYLGSFSLGALFGSLGDRMSLGFIAETEKQVEAHLRGHLERLPAADHRSRAIVNQMTHDEVSHGAQASALGADALPMPLRAMMRLTSQVMTRTSYWL